MRLYTSLFVCILLATKLFSQEPEIQSVTSAINSEMLALEDTLSALSISILTDSLLINRQQANDQFCKLFEDGMQNEGAYELSLIHI